MVMEYCALGSLDRCLRHNRKKLLGRSMAPIRAMSSLSDVTSSGSSSNGSSNMLNKSLQHNVMDTILTLDDLINFCYQICRGMAYITSLGVIHRDLATRNVLLTSEMTAKICDFGMAREESEYTLERTNVSWNRLM